MLLERLAEFGRHDEPAFTVNGVCKFSVEHRVVGFRNYVAHRIIQMVGNHFLPLSTTRTFKLYPLPATLVKLKSIIFYTEIAKRRNFSYRGRSLRAAWGLGSASPAARARWRREAE